MGMSARIGNRKIVFVILGFFVSLGFVGSVSGAIITVDDDGPADYSTIQAAVDAANTGDVIQVAAGTYTENVVVINSVEIIGTGDDKTIVTPDEGDYIFHVSANNVKISGFTIVGVYSEKSMQTGIYVDSSDAITISDNNFLDNFFGIYLHYSSNVQIINNSITGKWKGTYGRGFGIAVYHSINNSIESNSLQDLSYYGIIVIGVGDGNNVISKNELTSLEGIAIEIRLSKGNVVSDNVISSARHGIELEWSPENTIVTGNIVRSSKGVGIIYGSLYNAQYPKNNTIYNNIFNNTANFAFYSYPYGNWNTSKQVGTNIVGGSSLGGNFWAKPDGTGFSETCTDTDSDGICDSIYTLAAGNVDYLPLAQYVPSADTDGDGLTDSEETTGWDITTYDCYGNPTGTRHVDSNPNDVDEDLDGLNDLEERDGWLVKYNVSNPTPPTKKISIEYAMNLDPRNADWDNDGFNDGDESKSKTDPNRADTDCDGAWDTNDKFEVDYGLNPLDADTDDDGITDGYEIDLWIESMGYDPSVPELVPEDVLLVAVAKTNDPVMPAKVDIAPDTLNLKSNGNWITAYIELPVGSPDDVVLESILLEGEIQAVTDTKYDFVTDASEYIVDQDGDGILERMVKFDHGQVAELLSPADEVTLSVTGETSGGTFEASDTIKVIAEGETSNDVSLKVNKKVKPIESGEGAGESRAKITIDLLTTGNQEARAVSVKEYIPEDLTVSLTDGTYVGFGLIWQVGMVEGKETVYYVLNLPEVSEPTTYELRTVVEYQDFDDLMTLEKTSYLIVNPNGKAMLDKGKESKSVKAKGKGYSKVQWGVPNSKGGSASNGKKKGHDKDKGKPENPGNGNDKEKGKGKKD